MNSDEKLKCLTGEVGFTPEETALSILEVDTLDDIQTSEELSKYLLVLTKILDSIIAKEFKIIEDLTEIEMLKGEVYSSDSFIKKREIFGDTHILKKDIDKWLKDNDLLITENLTDLNNTFNSLENINTSPSIEQLKEKLLSNRERENLLKVIALLTMAFVDAKKLNLYGSRDKPNIDQISSHLEELLKTTLEKSDKGITHETNRKRITEGLELLKQHQ